MPCFKSSSFAFQSSNRTFHVVKRNARALSGSRLKVSLTEDASAKKTRIVYDGKSVGFLGAASTKLNGL
jgi:hypothetical protein